ncbi:MAG: ABC transporter permease subunit, partial [Acidimicrobiia bacterium]
MLTNPYTKAVGDRWLPIFIAAVSTAVLFVFGMAVYKDVDLSIYTDLPEGFQSLFGLTDINDVGSLAYSALLSSYGMLVMAGVAIAAGSASIAGEEKNGSMGLLLSNPLSRNRVLSSKTGALFTVLVGGFIVLWGVALITPRLLDVSIANIDVNALLLMMLVNAAFYGFLAYAIGAWTGRTGTASGSAAALMVVSFFAVGLLPLAESLADLAKFFPWYYYQNGDPLSNGMPWGDFALLLGCVAAFIVFAFVGFNRRDLKERSVGTKLIDRLRANKVTGAVADRLAGGARVSHIWTKTASDHQILLYIIAPMMFLLTFWVGPMYNLIDDSLKTLGDSLPDALLAMVGGGDLSTPEGWYQVEMYGLMLPISLLVITIVMGSAAIAGAEHKRTMGMLLSNPVSRTAVVLQKTAVMVLFALIVGFATFAGTWAGSAAGNLGIDPWNIAATCMLGVLLGLSFGTLALALGGATGSTQIASYGATAAAAVSFVINGFLPLSENLEALTKLQPFYYYLSSDPLNNGMDWGHAAVLLILSAVLVALAVVAFNRRGIVRGG